MQKQQNLAEYKAEHYRLHWKARHSKYKQYSKKFKVSDTVAALLNEENA